MPKFAKKTIIPVIAITIILIITFLETSHNDSLYRTSTQVFDSLSHLSFTSPENPNNQEKQPQQNKNKNKNKNKKHSVSSGSSSLLLGSKDELTEINEVKMDPCTVQNPISKGFIDLRGLSALGNENKPISWNAKGYDSGKNYTISVCSNPFKKHHDEATEIQDKLNQTLIGAYYIDALTNKYVSIGEYSTEPKFRGRKLTLTYENGSYCNSYDVNTGLRLRKSTILTFTCDREMSAKASVSYIGSSNDCTYFFEVKSHHACPTAAKANNLAAVWIFLFIFLAALFVYLSGGLLYRHMKGSRKTSSKV
ncbi:conserved hypothetical protein [Lodderomyces elongisporus NRRL YB-4239]|uniref:MRH domain-containing protein n=1 Tax=Lodderomyces elongisporus (strain ATCC 11503 / CBS 2605 / JCM 1781 / NBRC 1676 / NRRL YB-4239) TaxID=379508 RepID=A5DWQ2_LODEL|nr:conserved hypothetical protein [Lodderomyces elongisporus NRRL YB-4239]